MGIHQEGPRRMIVLEVLQLRLQQELQQLSHITEGKFPRLRLSLHFCSDHRMTGECLGSSVTWGDLPPRSEQHQFSLCAGSFYKQCVCDVSVSLNTVTP
ncbi:hypothetical protein FKM82_028668 [Ascaphus truei]